MVFWCWVLCCAVSCTTATLPNNKYSDNNTIVLDDDVMREGDKNVHFEPPLIWPNGQPITIIQICILVMGPIVYCKSLDWIRDEVRQANAELERRKREQRLEMIGL